VWVGPEWRQVSPGVCANRLGERNRRRGRSSGILADKGHRSGFVCSRGREAKGFKSVQGTPGKFRIVTCLEEFENTRRTSPRSGSISPGSGQTRGSGHSSCGRLRRPQRSTMAYQAAFRSPSEGPRSARPIARSTHRTGRPAKPGCPGAVLEINEQRSG